MGKIEKMLAGLANADLGLLVLRLGVFGMLSSLHGWGKVHSAFNFLVHGSKWGFIGVVERLGLPFPTFFALCSATAEGIAATLLVLGLWTRSAALMVAISMSVATYNNLAKSESGELAALFVVPALAVLLLGPGRYSVDGSSKGKRR